MSEQATNSPADAHAQAFGKLQGFFGGDEPEKPQGEPQEDATANEPAQDEAQGAEATDQEQQQESSQAQPEEKEVVIDGETYIVPAKIADRFIHHADYTRKTQDIAERARALAAEKEAMALSRAFEQSIVQERNQWALLDAQIAGYSRLDWQAMDTEQLLKARAQLDQLKDARGALETQINAKKADFDGRVAQTMQQALDAGTKYIAQHVKGYDDNLRKDLFAYGQSEGYTQEELGRIVDPRIIVTLWKAKQWDALKASQPGVNNRAARAAPAVRPGASQRQVTPTQKLKIGIRQAKSPTERKRAAEDYFEARFK